MAIELVQVTKTYGAVRALVGVNASFPDGRISMVLGPNGSGKSTLLSLVGTLTRPTTGEVRHGSIGRSRQEIRRALGWLGHDSLCYADLTGRENLRFAARLHGLPGGVADAACERFKIGGFLDRPFRTYSRGQRQRIALARALLHSPRLLLLDEPTTGLDRTGVTLLRAVLREEIARGVTVLVVTHDTSFTDLADHTVELDRGRTRAKEAKEA